MPAPPAAVATPLVSVVVRSTDRPTLAAALASIGAQDYPAIEIVVVGASGPQHPEPPANAGPHPIRFVRCGARRTRPQAANDGLDATRGEWITFLDDDDKLLPGHTSGLMAERLRAPQARVVYGFARAKFDDGRVQRFGQPFSIAQLYTRNFMHLSMAVFARSLLDEGCRCDEAMLTHQDWDLFLQFAQRTPFHFVPRETFEWHVEVGSSGAGAGANQDDNAFARYRDLIYAKWREHKDRLIDRVKPMVEEAARLSRENQLEAAQARCHEALALSPNDPFALNVLASVERSLGDEVQARRTQQLAVALCPHNAGLTFNLGILYRAQGEPELARRCCERALELDPNFRPAKALLADLSHHPTSAS